MISHICRDNPRPNIGGARISNMKGLAAHQVSAFAFSGDTKPDGPSEVAPALPTATEMPDLTWKLGLSVLVILAGVAARVRA